MPATVHPAPHAANAFSPTLRAQLAEDSMTLLHLCAGETETMQCKELLQDSFGDWNEKQLVGVNNGFVQACISAYSNHHHLVIRPDDVWITILTQLSLYVNANAEALRSHFVSHSGKKELVVVDGGDRYTTSYARIAGKFTGALEKNIKDPSLRDWILQDFSTTTNIDRAIGAIAMMGTLQTYFTYKVYLKCGIPSVTLEGTREDWVKLRDAVADPKRLPAFGKETTEWSKVLRVVLNRFVDCFDHPKASRSKDFWQKIAHYSGGGSGPRYWSGWITAFCFWNEDGKSLRSVSGSWPASVLKDLLLPRLVSTTLRIDGQEFHKINSNDVPPALVSVPLIVNDNGKKFDGKLIAGCVGYTVSESGERLEKGGTGMDTLKPETGWWMFEVGKVF
ncbi:hypothetical protein K432DRAFT_381253 [Lepidopterella palustris CBS 459.81]|uniref:DUF4419 domain-containing protein n=1 Tax=Lepidopterella palustris CBS 459.81 TaxID=1314670 RepID=A0A8E2ECK6_9PEZI|nr:hypothetical protein K432DRAFT_381253 [Lepidopterella palustris CBS 459.81]